MPDFPGLRKSQARRARRGRAGILADDAAVEGLKRLRKEASLVLGVKRCPEVPATVAPRRTLSPRRRTIPAASATIATIVVAVVTLMAVFFPTAAALTPLIAITLPAVRHP